MGMATSTNSVGESVSQRATSGARVGHDDEAGFFEGAGNVVGEVARREATSNGDGASVRSEFEDSTLAVGACRDDGDVSRVIHSCDEAGCKDDFLPRSGLGLVTPRSSDISVSYVLPSLANVDHIDSVGACLPQVWLHVDLEIL